MLTIREGLYLLLLVALIGGGIFGIKKIGEWRQGAAENALAQPVLKAHSGLATDAGKADENRDAVDYAVDQGRSAYQSQYQEDKRHDPETADRATRPVPQRVRDNLRQRRLARERAGCVGEECQARPGSEEVAERP